MVHSNCKIWYNNQNHCFAVKSRSRKSSLGSMGVLITHDSYKFNKNNCSRDYLVEWWQCSEKIGPTRCRATASTQSLDGKNYFLRTCSKPEDHMHVPDKLSIFKDRIMVDIKTITRNLPTTAIGKSNYGKFPPLSFLFLCHNFSPIRDCPGVIKFSMGSYLT